jgi:hypothetical protein
VKGSNEGRLTAVWFVNYCAFTVEGLNGVGDLLIIVAHAGEGEIFALSLYFHQLPHTDR